MKILITGASGFVGKKLTERLARVGHVIIPVSLRHHFDPGALNGVEAVIHLAGESIADGRWTADKKKRILDSRVEGSRILLDHIESMKEKPRVIISASAVGFYGDRGDEILGEESRPGSGFLADVVKAWEQETIGRKLDSVRRVAMRFGIVLGEGGALRQMLQPFKLGVGGPIGDGKQWMSWIHIDDLISMFEFVLASDVSGVVNAVSPNPIMNEQFSSAIAEAMGTSSRWRVPAGVLKLMLGEKADLLLQSQRVHPVRMMDAGFKFRYPEIKKALHALIP